MSTKSMFRSRILLVGSIVISVAFAGLVLTVKTTSQNKSLVTGDDKRSLISKIERSADLELRINENNDSPLRISEAKSKDISAAEFIKLTGSETNLMNVSSVPSMIVHNTSDKTVVSFMLFIRAPHSRSMRTLSLPGTSIEPGGTYLVKPEFFVGSDRTTVVDENGRINTVNRPKVDSTKYWIDFAERSSLYVAIGVVSFKDGSKWVIREEGEIQ